MNDADKRYKRIAMWLGVIGIIAFFVSIGFYGVALHEQGLSDESMNWGTFGDFVGGFAGTVIALATLIALALTLHLQASELAQTRSQLEQSESRRVRPMIKGSWAQLMPGVYRYAWRLRNVGLGPAVIDREEISVVGRFSGAHGVEDIEMIQHWRAALDAAVKGAPPGRVTQTSLYYPMWGMSRILAVGEEHELVVVTFSGEEAQMGIVLLQALKVVTAFRSLAGDKLDTHTQLSVV